MKKPIMMELIIYHFSSSAGVPETPVITLEQNSVILRWRRPDANGSPITLYQIIAT